MFKHILLPTDGSKLSDRAVQRGIELAEALGARVTAVHVIPEFRMMADESFVLPNSVEIQRRYEKESKTRSDKMLNKVGERAAAAGVKFEGLSVTGARVETLGADAVDSFYVCSPAGAPLDAAQRARVEQALIEAAT